uniref:Dedicator of cytokinesis N-terminal domain-containing protein n=1 Tax=Paramormyrops kingsleyae TaxID=1676925 RepID=A0A3B3T9P4_9TELE
MAPWTKTTTERYGVVKWNYKASGEKHLSLEVGDTVQIQESCEEKHLCPSQGVFPACVIQLKEAIIENHGGQELVTSAEMPLVKEVTTTLREWGSIWKQLYVANQKDRVNHVRGLMWELMEWRSQLLSGTLPSDEFKELKQKVTSKIDYGNKYINAPAFSHCICLSLFSNLSSTVPSSRPNSYQHLWKYIAEKESPFVSQESTTKTK